MSTNSLHRRRSIRLGGYDYTTEGGYYITCVTQGRENLFGEVVEGVMRLNKYGKIVRDEWFRTANIRPNVELIEEEFVVMPNHIHGIIWLSGSCSGTARCATTVRQFGKMIPGSIPTIIRSFKSAVSKQINILRQTYGVPIWQRNYYEHIIRTDKDYENIANYIYDNPLYWDKDDENQPG